MCQNGTLQTIKHCYNKLGDINIEMFSIFMDRKIKHVPFSKNLLIELM